MGSEINRLFKIITKNAFLFDYLKCLEDKQELFLELNFAFYLQDLSKILIDTLIRAPNMIFSGFIGFKITETFLSTGSIQLTFSKILEEIKTIRALNYRLIDKIKEAYDFLELALLSR